MANNTYKSYLLIGSGAGQDPNEIVNFSVPNGNLTILYNQKIQRGDYNRLAVGIVTDCPIGNTISVTGQFVTNTAILGLK